MIEKSKFYTIIFLILMMSGISMLLVRSYYRTKATPATMLNAMMIEYTIRASVENLHKQIEKQYEHLLRIAPDSTHHRIHTIRTASNNIEEKIYKIREEFTNQSGGYNPETFKLIGGEDKVVTIDALSNSTEKLKKQVRNYITQLNALSTLTLNVLHYFPAPSEIRNGTGFLSIYHQEEWLKGTTYSDTFINDLTIYEYLTQNTAIDLSMKQAELKALKHIENQLTEDGPVPN